MINRYHYKDTVWVDITQPTEDDISTVLSEFHIRPSIANELLSPSVKSRVELHNDYIYLILHFPAFKHSHSFENKQEVDFIVGKNFLITARYDTIDPIDKFAKIVEVNTILDRGIEENCTAVIFFGILQEIYQSLVHELEYIESWLGNIEQGIFAGEEKEMVYSISEVSRNLLNFKKATDFHAEALESLDVYGGKLFAEHFSYHVRRIKNEYSKITHHIQNNWDSMTELRETNNALLSTKQSEIMKNLTIVSFITLPLSLFAALFGMNTSSTPIVGGSNDFWIILSFMALGAATSLVFFKYKRWF